MKKVSWITGLLILILFSGCFDTVEEYTIAENGSGTYVNSIDMGKMLGLAKTMGGGEEMKEIEKLNIDTIVHLRDLKDSMTKLNDAEKKIAATGTLKVQMDAKEEKFNFTFTFPFSSAAEIAPIQRILKKAKGDIVGDMMTKVMGEGNNKHDDMLGGIDEDGGQQDEMGANLDSYYTSVYEKGKFSRKLNKEKYATVSDDKALKSLQEMAQMGLAINMKTIINLPRPAKKAEGKGVKLSDDKKKITIEGTLDDFFEEGSYFEYNIEY